MSVLKGKFLKVLPENYSQHFKLSVSKIKTFESCKAKFYFSYIKYIQKKEWEFQIFGSFLHEVLERFEEFIKNGDSSEENVIMKKAFNNAWKAVPFKNGEKFTKWSEKVSAEQKKECLAILNSYLSLRKSLKENGNVSKTLDTEKKFNILLQENLLINGFIDLLQEDSDGILHVIDYKSSSHTKYLKKDKFQLQTYAYALFLENPELQK
jgi:ATP-dependent helicase/DNAse subunit B